MLAVVRLESTGGDTPIPVPADSPVGLPEPGPFGGAMVLYGATDGARPGHGELGCELRGPSATQRHRGVDPLGALGAGDRTVAGSRLTPLATISLSGDSTLVCSGPVARSAQPLYLLAERRRAVPRALAIVFGLQCLVMGVGALALLRHRRRRGAPLSPG